MHRYILLTAAARKPSNFGDADVSCLDHRIDIRCSRRRAPLIAIIAAAVLAAARIGPAAPPDEATPPENPITLPETTSPDEASDLEAPQALRAIQRAMRGETDLRTDDPVLEPLLQLLGDKARRRSPLEKLPSRRELLGREQPLTSEAVRQSPRRSKIARPGGNPDPRWRAAESLLKSARLLDRLEPADENRQELVNRMRQQAVRILTDVDRPAKTTTSDPDSPPHSVSLPSPDE
jgi:hypothetical protein